MTHFTPTEHGAYQATLTLDPASYAVVEPALVALSAPRNHHHDGSDDHGRDGHTHGSHSDHDHGTHHADDWQGGEVGPDQRTVDQRRADALIELCAKLAGVPDPELPATGAKTQVIVTMDYDQLRDRLGYGTTIDGQPLTPAMVRMLACDAAITPVILRSESQPLDVGRTSRLVTPAQRIALYIRDRGCTFPGCDRLPSWCDAHHLTHWLDLGHTKVQNLALLCRHHHTIVHQRGYTGTLGPNGVTWHRTPRHLQPTG